MTTPAHADPNSGLLKSEPVMAAAAATWLLANVGLILAHYNLLGSVQWNGLSALLFPPVTAGFLAGIGWAVRRVVTPAHKLLAAHESAAVLVQPAPIVVQVDGRDIPSTVASDDAPASVEPVVEDGLPVIPAPADLATSTATAGASV